MNPDIDTLSDQADESRPSGMSPRLDAVIAQLPKYQRTRMAYGLYAEGVRTLTDLCATKRARLQRLKNVGKRSIANLEDALAMLGLSLADRPLMTTKTQTSAQRVTNPVWLRQQIAALVADCDETITEDRALMAKERDDARRAFYEASIDCHRHWKKQLERILAGKTTIEDLADTLDRARSSAMTPRIHLIVERADGSRSEHEAVAQVTEDMSAVAEDLLVTLTTGTRPPLKGLYELCARAFSTSRDDAKERLVAATYGMSEAKIEAKSESRGQMLTRLATTRREKTAAYAEVVAWVQEQFRLGELVTESQAPGWDRYTRACIAYGYAVRNMEAWLDAEEITS